MLSYILPYSHCIRFGSLRVQIQVRRKKFGKKSLFITIESRLSVVQMEVLIQFFFNIAHKFCRLFAWHCRRSQKSWKTAAWTVICWLSTTCSSRYWEAFYTETVSLMEKFMHAKTSVQKPTWWAIKLDIT